MRLKDIIVGCFLLLSFSSTAQTYKKDCSKCDTLVCAREEITPYKFFTAYWDGSQFIILTGENNANIVQNSTGNYSISFVNTPETSSDYDIEIRVTNTGGDDIIGYTSNITTGGFDLLVAEQDNGTAGGVPRNNNFRIEVEDCLTTCVEFEEATITSGGVQDCEDCKDYIESLIPDNLDNDPTNELQTLSQNGNPTTPTTSITLSNGNTIPIYHPETDLDVEECTGDFENGTGRTGWYYPWTAVTQNANVPNTLLDWVNISNARTSPDCITDMTYNVNLGNHLLYLRRIRAYLWVDYRLLINGVAVSTKTYHTYIYEDEREDTNPDIIPPQQYQIRNAGSGHGFRLNVPASSTVQVQARVRYQAVGFQTSSYFRYIGGLRSEANFSFNPREEITDVSILNNEGDYWVLQEPLAYSHGVGDAPDGAKTYKTESSYQAAVKNADKQALKENQDFINELESLLEPIKKR